MSILLNIFLMQITALCILYLVPNAWPASVCIIFINGIRMVKLNERKSLDGPAQASDQALLIFITGATLGMGLARHFLHI